MKVIVCGTRGAATDAHYRALRGELDEIAANYGPLELISGGCKNSADELAERYAEERGIAGDMKVFYADWAKNGKTAGFMRNSEMAEERADELVAIWDGKSNGTKDMIVKALAVGTWVRIIPATL